MANGNSVEKKTGELLLRWYNLSTLRGRVGQPGALPASKLDAEEAALRRETEAFINREPVAVVPGRATTDATEARAA